MRACTDWCCAFKARAGRTGRGLPTKRRWSAACEPARASQAMQPRSSGTAPPPPAQKDSKIECAFLSTPNPTDNELACKEVLPHLRLLGHTRILFLQRHQLGPHLAAVLVNRHLRTHTDAPVPRAGRHAGGAKGLAERQGGRHPQQQGGTSTHGASRVCAPAACTAPPPCPAASWRPAGPPGRGAAATSRNRSPQLHIAPLNVQQRTSTGSFLPGLRYGS